MSINSQKSRWIDHVAGPVEYLATLLVAQSMIATAIESFTFIELGFSGIRILLISVAVLVVFAVLRRNKIRFLFRILTLIIFNICFSFTYAVCDLFFLEGRSPPLLVTLLFCVAVGIGLWLLTLLEGLAGDA